MSFEYGEKRYYYQTSINDFRNTKSRRQFKKVKKKIQKELHYINKKMQKTKIANSIENTRSTKIKPHKCPHNGCNSTKIISWGTYPREIRFFLDKIVQMIFVNRFRCKICKKTFSILPKGITKYRRYADKAFEDMVDMKLWTYTSYRRVGYWERIHGCSHTTVMREIRRLGAICREAMKHIKVKFSGIVCIDKIWFRKVKGIWYYGVTAVDARYGRVIYEHTYYANTPKAVEKYGKLKGEDIVENKTEAIERFLKELSEIITPKVIITDDNSSYDRLIEKIFPRAKHFLCTFHIILNIKKAFKTPRNFRLKKKDREFKKQLLDVFDLENTKDIKEAERKLKEVLARERDYFGTDVGTLLESLRKNKERLFPFLRYGINRTNNPVEFYFNFAKKLQKIARKFSTLEGIKNLLSVYALYYNFMPKMEGKNKGKSPLNIAGWNTKMQMWDFIRSKAYPNF